MKSILLLAFTGLSYWNVVAQPVAATEFAVASVKSNTTADSSPKEGALEKITLTPSSLTMWNVTLRSAIRWAYDLKDYQLFGPGWIDAQHYDITAKPSGEAPATEMRTMLQRLLADRFHLVVRHDVKELPVYAMLYSGKKRDRFKPSSGDNAAMKPVGGALEFRAYTMPELADRLATRPFKLDRVVLDKTGLEGRYDLKLEIADDVGGIKMAVEEMDRGGPGAPSMLHMLQVQLGLVFKAEKAPVEALIVERADKVPTEN